MEGDCDLIEDDTSDREAAVRPVIPMMEAPAEARAWAVRLPMPRPPPVTITVFPARDSWGRVGEMAG